MASGTVTAGGVAQTFAALNPMRRRYSFQNLSVADLYIEEGATATTSSLRIPAGALYESEIGAQPTGALSVYGATTGQAFWYRER